MDEIVRKASERSKKKNICKYPTIIKGCVDVTDVIDEVRKFFKDGKLFEELLTNKYDDMENTDDDEE